MAQLLIVPRACVPSVEKRVRSSALPRAGPFTAIVVLGVMRRLKADAWT